MMSRFIPNEPLPVEKQLRGPNEGFLLDCWVPQLASGYRVFLAIEVANSSASQPLRKCRPVFSAFIALVPASRSWDFLHSCAVRGLMEALFLTQEDGASNKNGKNLWRYLPRESRCGTGGVGVAGGVGNGLWDIARVNTPQPQDMG